MVQQGYTADVECQHRELGPDTQPSLKIATENEMVLSLNMTLSMILISCAGTGLDYANTSEYEATVATPRSDDFCYNR